MADKKADKVKADEPEVEPSLYATVEGFAVILNGVNFEGSSVTVDFGDKSDLATGSILSGRLSDIRHEYDAPGDYTAKVWSGDKEGKADLTAKFSVG